MAGTTQIPWGVPFGDIFTVQTPKLDELSNRLYQQQLFRRQQQMQESKEMDSLMGKELSRVRGIDAPDVIDKYTEWKNLRKQLYFDPSVQNDPKKYNDIQMRSNMLQGDLFRNINESAEYNANVKEFTKERGKKPDDFADNSGEILATAMNTPLAALAKTKHGDLSDIWGATRRKDLDYNFQKDINAAVGSKERTPYTSSTVTPDGLQTVETPYKMYGNSPYDFMTNLMGTIVGEHRAHDKAVQLWRQIPQQEKDRVNQSFSQLTPEYWQQSTGSKTPQNLEPTNPQSEAEQYVSYLAKRRAVETHPEPQTQQFRTNLSAEMKAKQSFEISLEKFRQTGRIDLAELKQSLKDKSEAEQNTALGNYWNVLHENAIKRATQNNEIYYSTAGGIPKAEYAVPSSPDLNKIFQIGAGDKAFQPDTYRTDATGEYLRPVYYKRDRDKYGAVTGISKNANGDPIEDEQLSQPVPATQFKATLGQHVLSKKSEEKELRTLGGKYTISGKAYTKKQLNDMGYSDEKIQEYIKEGLIK